MPESLDAPAPSDAPAPETRSRRELRKTYVRPRRWWKPIVQFVAIVVLAALAVAITKAIAIRLFVVPSESMNPTLITNDRIVVELVTPWFDDYDRGDVVVFRDPSNWLGNDTASTEPPNFLQLVGLLPEDTGYLVKRIAAVPGDTIRGEADGTVYVNDVLATEGWSPVAPQEPFIWTLGPEDYWMMGDNRGGSADSRLYGPASADDMVGRVWWKILPLERFGEVE